MNNEEKAMDDNSSKNDEIKDIEKENEPPSNSSKENKNNVEPFFLMTLEDNLGNYQQIKIFKNSDPSELAFNFCKENNLDFTAMKYIKSNIKNVLKKFDEHANNLYDNNDQIKEEENEDEYLTESTLKSIEKTKKKEIETNNIIPENSRKNTEIVELNAEEEFLFPKKEDINIKKNKTEKFLKFNKISPKKREISENFQKVKNSLPKNKNPYFEKPNNILNDESIFNNGIKLLDSNGEKNEKINEKSFSDKKQIQDKLTENGVPVLNNQVEIENDDCFMNYQDYEYKISMKDLEKEEDNNKRININNKNNIKNRHDRIERELSDYSLDLNRNLDSESINLIKFYIEKNSNNNSKIKKSLPVGKKENSYLKNNKNKKNFYSNHNLNYNNKSINDTDFSLSNINFDKSYFNNYKYNNKKEKNSKSLYSNKLNIKKKNNLGIIENFLGKLIKMNNEVLNIEKNDINKKKSQMIINKKYENINRSLISNLNKSIKRIKVCKTPPIKNSIKIHKFAGNTKQNSNENCKSRNKYFAKNLDKKINLMSKSASDLIDYMNSKIFTPTLKNKNIKENYMINTLNNSIRLKLNKNIKRKNGYKLNNSDKKDIGRYTVNFNSKNICFKHLNNKIAPYNIKKKFIHTCHNSLCNYTDNFKTPSIRESSKTLKKIHKNFLQDSTNISKEYSIQEKFLQRTRKYCSSHVNHISNNKLNSYGRKTGTILRNNKCLYQNENIYDLNKLILNKTAKDMKNINGNKIVNGYIFADGDLGNFKTIKNNSKHKTQNFKKLDIKKSLKKSSTKNKNEEKDLIKRSMKNFVNKLINNNDSLIPKYIKSSNLHNQKTNLTFYNNNNNNLFININGEINQNDEKINTFFSKIFNYIDKNKSNSITLMNGSFNEKINLFPSQIKKLLMKMINIIYLNKINNHNLSVINSNKNKDFAIKNDEQIIISKNSFVNEMSYIYKYYLNKDSKKKLMLFKKDLNKFIQNDILNVSFQPISTLNNFRFESILPFTP